MASITDGPMVVPPVPWSRTLPDLFATLETSPEGLSEEEAERRFAAWGPNEFERGHGAQALRIFLRQFGSPLIFMLVAAAGISFLIGDWAEAIVIALAVVVNTGLGFYQEYSAEHTLEKLTSYIRERTRVVRQGDIHEIDARELVPGDVIELMFGARVPADARIISSTDCAADESFITGESLPVRKSIETLPEGTPLAERTDMAYAGSLIVEGRASALVVATDERTELGRIARLVSETRREPTPLQRSLTRLAWLIFFGALVVISLIFFLGIARGEAVLSMLLLSAAVAVGAVPEALPIALTVILARGAERIAHRRGIMRSLSAAETLGSTTLVMTDKTGTLTQAKMSVTSVADKHRLIERRVPDSVDLQALSERERAILGQALLSTEAVVENPDDPAARWQFIGRPLEVNIALAARDAGLPVVSLTRERRVSLLPFNSTNKFSVFFDKGSHSFCILGAPEVLLKRSRLTKDDYLALEKAVLEESGKGKRLVGVARLPAGHSMKRADYSKLADLEFQGVIVLHDPVRPEAASAVERIKSHGARVVMVTGDLKGTALSVAREIGWKVGEDEALSSEELRTLSDAELKELLPRVRVFWRVTPEDKLRIGRLYQSRGEVVAMTGDGVNDAAALKAVDIGVAIGSGSDVAKSAADLVLLDDNFGTIVDAIDEGRRIIANIRKAFVYLMSSCLDEVILIGGALIFALPLPLSALQIIWVNFFTGSLPALSFAYEENRDVATRRVGRDSVFSSDVLILTLGIGTLSSFLLLGLYWSLIAAGVAEDTAKTTLYLCFSSYILAVAFSFKSLHRPLGSYRWWDNFELDGSVLFAALTVIASVTIPPLRDFLGLVPIAFGWAAFVALWLVFNIALVEAGKWLFRRRGILSA